MFSMESLSYSGMLSALDSTTPVNRTHFFLQRHRNLSNVRGQRHRRRWLRVVCAAHVPAIAHPEACPVHAKSATSALRHASHHGQCRRLLFPSCSIYIHLQVSFTVATAQKSNVTTSHTHAHTTIQTHAHQHTHTCTNCVHMYVCTNKTIRTNKADALSR